MLYGAIFITVIHIEKDNRDLAAQLIKAISEVSGLENRGVYSTAQLAETITVARPPANYGFTVLMNIPIPLPIRVLLEIGDNAVSRELLLNPDSQQKMGAAVKKALTEWIRIKGL